MSIEIVEETKNENVNDTCMILRKDKKKNT